MEDRFESLELIVKERPDKESWFDAIHDYITQDCEGDPEDDERPCTCGLESMSGSSGSLQQCFDRMESVTHGIKYIDVARAIMFLAAGRQEYDESVIKVIHWAEAEIEFEEEWNDPIEEIGEEE